MTSITLRIPADVVELLKIIAPLTTFVLLPHQPHIPTLKRVIARNKGTPPNLLRKPLVLLPHSLYVASVRYFPLHSVHAGRSSRQRESRGQKTRGTTPAGGPV